MAQGKAGSVSDPHLAAQLLREVDEQHPEDECMMLAGWLEGEAARAEQQAARYRTLAARLRRLAAGLGPGPG